MNDKEKIFLSILERHKGIIYKVANTYGYDSAEQEDLIQEIVVQIWLSIANFNDQYKWSTWIYRIALNTSISHYRKNKTRKERTVQLSPIIEIPHVPEAPFMDERFRLLRQFIRELKELDRALMLLYLDGLTSKEMAKVMDITVSNVTTKISRIRKKLKHKFENHKA
ncbi:MAG: sigma-70 family RNA polymerase sigma factor [Bacteroidota bacterium]